MRNILHDAERARRWRALRRKIKTADAPERYTLLRHCGNEMRVLAPQAARNSKNDWDVNSAADAMTGLGALLGGWRQADPANPEWPGRDRLFLGRVEDLLSAACGLAVLGFFPTTRVAEILDDALATGRDGHVPGLDAPCAAPEEIPALVWEAAVESARSKRRFREYFGPAAGAGWATPDWLDSPAVWRTFVVWDALLPETPTLRDLPAREGDRPAGLAAVVMAHRNDAGNLAEEWRTAGWETTVVTRSDCLGMYASLASAPPDKPAAIMLAIGQTPSSLSSRTTRRTRQSSLLGELSDEQFHAILDESLHF